MPATISCFWRQVWQSSKRSIRVFHWREPLIWKRSSIRVKAEPGQAGGAPAAGGYVIDTTENTFQAMVQTSATFPILLFLWVPTDDRLFAMARALGDAVNKLNGQIQLSRIDIASNPSIAQAFQIQARRRCSR